MRISLVGCGRWGRNILRDLIALGAEVSVADPDPEARRRAASAGAGLVAAHLDELPPGEGIVIATPTATHARVVELALERPSAIFVEKPMTNDARAARRLAERAGGRLFVMDKWRYHPVVEAMRAEIEAGRVGNVLAIRTTRLGWGNPHRDVGGLWILAPHDLSIVMHLIGEIPPLASAHPIVPRYPELGFTARLGGPGGPAIGIDVSIASPESLRRCVVVGTRGTLELRGSSDDRLFVRDGPPGESGAPERVVAASGKMPLLAELERFLGFLSGGPPPLSSAAEGLLVVERLAEIEAALRGQTV
jgi:predicted dehydrogenase